jgi:hypothetical protein
LASEYVRNGKNNILSTRFEVMSDDSSRPTRTPLFLPPKPLPHIIHTWHPLASHTCDTRVRRRHCPNKIKSITRILSIWNAKRLGNISELSMFPTNQHIPWPCESLSCCRYIGGIISGDGAVGRKTKVGGKGCYGFKGARTGTIYLR